MGIRLDYCGECTDLQMELYDRVCLSTFKLLIADPSQEHNWGGM